MMLILCPFCTEGIADGSTCTYCAGSGKIDLTDYKFRLLAESNFRAAAGAVWDALTSNTTLPGNVFRSYLILEALDATEYNALTAAQKDGVRIILSCGLVDLNDGKAGKVRLWSLFGEESTTVANLTALLD